MLNLNGTTEVTISFLRGSTVFPYDPPAGLSSEESLRYRIIAQSVWIADCEANGVSYSGKNGAAIRGSDYAERKRLISLLQ